MSKVWATFLFLLLIMPYFAQTAAQDDDELSYHLVWEYETEARAELVEWHPDGTMMAVASGTDVVILDGQTGEEIQRLHIDDHQHVADLGWNRDGSLFAAGIEYGLVRIYDSEWQEQASFEVHYLSVLDWHPLRDEIATASDTDTSEFAYSDRQLTVWTSDGEMVHVVNTLSNVAAIEYSPDGTLIAGIRYDIRGVLWNADTYRLWRGIWTGSRRRTFSDQHVAQSITWSPDSQRIALLSNDNAARVYSIVLWDVTTGQMVNELEGNADAFLYTLSWNPQADFLASGWGDGSIRIWNMTTNEPSLTIDENDFTVTSVAWSPDGRLLAGVSWAEGIVRLWEIELLDHSSDN